MMKTMSVEEARALIGSAKDYSIVDVREPVEFSLGHLPGAKSIPLGQIESRLAEIPRDRPIVLLCKSGGRAARAQEKLTSAGFADACVVTGGTDAWIAAGFPIVRAAKTVWSLERQVRFAAGILVLVGLFIPPWPYLSAFVGAGLVFAAITDSCAMGMLISKLPWNRSTGTS